MAKKHRHEEHENHERWLVSYADFITLLFAFFTVLYATSQKDISKAREFEQSIRKSFRSFLDFGGMQGGHTAFDEAARPIPPPIDLYPTMGNSAEVEAKVQEMIDKSMSEAEKQEVIASIRHDAAGVEITLASAALFPSGSDQFSDTGLKAINKIGAVLKASGKKIIVQGHTDNQPISTSRYASNWELSAARATKIVRYLASRFSIPGERLVVVAYADKKPIASNDTEEGRSKNRRIEIMMAMGEGQF
ncbi:MAG: OmpA family protein [Bdellovibrionales bacterium]